MTNQQIIESIEGGSVLYDLLLSDNPISLQSRMEHNAVLTDAVLKICFDFDFAAECLSRAKSILEVPEESGYLHPQRGSIAAYIYLLFATGHPSALEFIRRVANMNRVDFGATTALALRYARKLRSLSEKYSSECHIEVEKSASGSTVMDDTPSWCYTSFTTGRSLSIAV